MDQPTIRSLSETDKSIVTPWLRGYLEQHLAWWTEAYGAEPKLALEYLINREWNDLLRASRDAGQYVGIATQDEAALGIVLATLGTER